MRYLPMLILVALTGAPGAQAQSKLLESVKNNQSEALALCDQFKALNSKGISATSKETYREIAQMRNLNLLEAEILTTYVIGMNCPDVR